MHFIDISPYWGICLLYRPLDIIPDYKNCIVSIQRSFVRDHDVTTNFTFNIKNSPVVVNSLIEVNSQLNNLVSVRSLTVKSLSEAKTLINAAEYYCNSCTHSFIAYADLTYGNHIEHPIICKAKMLKIPDVNILPRTRLQDRGFV